MKNLRTLAAVLIVAVCMIVGAVAGTSNPTQAASGIIAGYGTFGSAAYTGTAATMTGTATYLYDYVQIEARGSLTPSQSMTVQPVFTSRSASCTTAITTWASPTYQTNGVIVGSGMFTITGDNPGVTQVPILGACFSVKVYSAGVFTPVITYRLVK